MATSALSDRLPAARAVPPMIPGLRDPNELDLRGLFRLIRRRWLLLLVCACLGAAGGLTAVKLRVINYTASTGIIVGTTSATALGPDVASEVTTAYGPDPASVQTQLTVMRAPEFLGRFVDRYDLTRDFVDYPGLAAVAEAARNPAPGLLVRLGLAPPVSTDPATADLRARLAVVDWLARRVEITTGFGQSNLITISYSAPDPAEAARIINQLTGFYIEERRNYRRQTVQNGVATLQERLGHLSAQLAEAEQKVAEYRSRHRLFAPWRDPRPEGALRFGEPDDSDVAPKTDPIDVQLGLMNTSLAALTGRQAALDAQLKRARDLRAGATPDIGRDSPQIVTLWQQQLQLSQQAAILAADVGSGHPELAALKAQQDRTTRALDQETGRLVANLENEARILQRETELAQAEVDRQIEAAGVQKGMMAGLEVLEQQAASSRELYETFLLRFMNLQTIVDLIESDVQMVDAADLPRWPSSIGNGRLMAFAVLAALLGGFFLALTADQRDRTSIRTAQDVQLRLGAAPLGTVPRIGRLARLVRWLRRRRVTPNPPFSPQAEALRAIEAKLRRYAPDQRVVLVTSSLRREGRTTFACGLAEAAARGGRPTALIDLDFRRPGVLRQLGIEHAPDLARWLEGHDQTHLPIHHDPVSGLDVLAPFAAPADPTRLVRSLRLEELLAELRQRYDRVVIDGGPVLGISETLLLAELADNVVFGVRAGRTPAAVALEGLRQVGRRAALVGVALLRVERAAAPLRAAVTRQRRSARHGVSVPAPG